MRKTFTINLDPLASGAAVFHASQTAAERTRISHAIGRILGADGYAQCRAAGDHVRALVSAEAAQHAAPDTEGWDAAWQDAWRSIVQGDVARDLHLATEPMADAEFLATWEVCWVSGPANLRRLSDSEASPGAVLQVRRRFEAERAKALEGNAVASAG
jgi:hypothetical protein